MKNKVYITHHIYYRGVIMIGLPFANRGSVELLEKMKYAQECSVR